jgi:hypothetical protein
MESKDKSEVPLFVIVTVFEAEVPPTEMLPILTDIGATEITGSA